MHDTRSRRNRGTAAQADRKVETVAERSLRRSSTARMLAAESAGSRQGVPRRRSGPIHLYHAVVRSASLSAAGILAAAFAIDATGSEPAPMTMTAVSVETAAAAPTLAAAPSWTPGASALASVRTDDAFTVSRTRAPRRFLDGEREMAEVEADIAPRSGTPLTTATSPATAVPAKALIEILLSPETAPVTAVFQSPRPNRRPGRMIEVRADPAVVCGFGSIVERGSAVFHRPPICI